MKNQKTEQRQAEIVSFLRRHGTLSVNELAEFLSVSDETIRRDAQHLAGMGDVLKLHGALSLPHHFGEVPFERRMRENAEAKVAVARAALSLVEDGDSLILDTGSTTCIFARELRAKRDLTVITNSTEIARTLAYVKGNKVYLAGGELNADDGGSFGPTAVDFIAKFSVKHTFISITAIDAIKGPMDATLADAEFANMAMTRGAHCFILADSSKFNQSALVSVCRFSDVDAIVTERVPGPEYSVALQDAGTQLLVATT